MKKLYFFLFLTGLAGMSCSSIFAQDFQQTQKLRASDAGFLSRFGRSVFVSGNQAVVGGLHTVYFFAKTTSGWEEVNFFKKPSPEYQSLFGNSVALSGKFAIIGNPGDDEKGEFAGAAYLYEKTASGWQEVQKLFASDAKKAARFGVSVSIDGDDAIVGTDQVHTAENNIDRPGEAYIFQRTPSGWEEVNKLKASDQEENDRFGYAVHISGPQAVVGAYHKNATYLFEKTVSGWEEVSEFTVLNKNNGFGGAVFLTASEVLVGAPLDVEKASGAGAAYVVTKTLKNISVSRLALVNAITGKVVPGYEDLQDDQTIDLSGIVSEDGQFPRLNIEAVTDPGAVGSVAMELRFGYNAGGKEKLLMQRTENQLPYAFFGDKDGDFRNWEPEPGYYELMAKPYAAPHLQGGAGKARTVRLRVTNIEGQQDRVADQSATPVMRTADNAAPNIIALTLVDAETNQPLQTLHPGDVINLQNYPDQNFNITATTMHEETGSVQFDLLLQKGDHHPLRISRTENKVPYAAFGDRDGQYRPWEPEPGHYQVKVYPFTGHNGKGRRGNPVYVDFHIIDEPVAPGPVADRKHTDTADESARLLLYPNPTFSRVNARIQSEQNYTLSIFNNDGKLVYRKAGEGKLEESIDLNRQQPGLYMVVLEAGGKRQSQRLLLK